MNMPITAPKPESNYKLAPKGTHLARVYKIINLGTHEGEWQGKPKVSQSIRIYWELPLELDKFTYVDKSTNEEVEVEKPFAISREFTLSMGSKSNLRPIVEGIIGTTLDDDEAFNFDIEQLLGKESLVTIAHEKSNDGQRTFAKVTGTAPLMKGQVCPPAVNEQVIIDVNTITVEQFDAQPEWIREKLADSLEWKTRMAPKTVGGTSVPYPEKGANEKLDPEDIPFN